MTPSWVVHRGSVTYIGSMLWVQDTDTHALIVQSLSTLLVSFFHPSDAPAGRLVSTEQPQGTTCICCSWAENLRETYTLISFLFLRSQLHRYISIKRCMIYFDTLWLLETICRVMKDFFFTLHLKCTYSVLNGQKWNVPVEQQSKQKEHGAQLSQWMCFCVWRADSATDKIKVWWIRDLKRFVSLLSGLCRAERLKILQRCVLVCPPLYTTPLCVVVSCLPLFHACSFQS